MQTAADAAFDRLGHVATAYTGASFTRAGTLSRTVNDWGYYVHCQEDKRRTGVWTQRNGVTRVCPLLPPLAHYARRCYD
jgi:hypothetical protein